MPDFSWNGWGILVSIAVALIPALLKFREELTRAIDLVAEFIGLLGLLFGVFLYATTLPHFERLQLDLGRISAESPGLAAQQMQTLWTLYSGSIALMVLGGLLAVSGLLGRLHAGIRRR